MTDSSEGEFEHLSEAPNRFGFCGKKISQILKKKIKMAVSKKLSFSTTTKSWAIFPKIS
jgi:hypothetical protein